MNAAPVTHRTKTGPHRAFADRISLYALAAAIIFAPAAAGGAARSALPLLAATALIAFIATLWARRERPNLALPGAALGLAALAAFTGLQAVPFPASWLELLSPRAAEIRSFVAGQPVAGAISYEPGESLHEATLLMVYALVTAVAYLHGRHPSRRQTVVAAIVLSGIGTLVLGGLHRILATPRMLGVFESSVPAATLWTTFVNHNHAAGFLAFTGIIALGHGLSLRGRKKRMAIAAGAVLILASIAQGSRSGLGITVVGLAAITLRFYRRQQRRRREAPPRLWLSLLLAFVAGAAVLWPAVEVLRRLSAGTEDPFRIKGKLLAVQSVGALILEHAWFGIGRRAYASVHPLYKSSRFQLTFWYPENLLIQRWADWGLVVGSVALLGLGYALVRRSLSHQGRRGHFALVLALVLLCVQNLVDFGLELPGIAVAFAATLGLTAPRRSLRLSVGPGWLRGLPVLLIPVLFVSSLCSLALLRGDLRQDLQALEGRAAKAQHAPATSSELGHYRTVVQRHPANANAWTLLAYLHETASPPDFSAAMDYANHALYLGSAYAEPYMIVGRLLLRAGHRPQGFESMRRAVSLSDPNRTQDFLRQALGWADDEAEAHLIVPRADPVQERLDPHYAMEAARVLTRADRKDWAASIIRSVGTPPNIPASDLLALARIALQAGDHIWAELLFRQRLKWVPHDSEAKFGLLEALLRRRSFEEFREVLSSLERQSGLPRDRLLRIKVRGDLEAGDAKSAYAALNEWRRLGPARGDVQREQGRLEATILLRLGRPAQATRTLTHTLRFHPEDIGLRMLRAKAQLRLGAKQAAMLDLAYVVRIRPEHTEAKRLIRRIERTPDRADSGGSPIEGTPPWVD